MAAFSTSFWLLVASAAAGAAGVEYLTRPQQNVPRAGMAESLATFEAQLPRLADVVTAEEDAAQVPLTGAFSSPPPPANAFAVDALGRLVVTARTVQVLDGWIAAAGIGKPIGLIEPKLRSGLPPLAADRAWALLRGYAAYRMEEFDTLAPLQRRLPERELLERTVALRRRHFDAVSMQELFGVHEARSLYVLEVARILADVTLTEAEQSNRLRELRAGLPPEVAAEEFGGAIFSFSMEREVAQMRARGLDNAEIVNFRRQYVDLPGAKSVVELERERLSEQREAWQQLHQAFMRERDQIYSSVLDPQERQSRLEELLRAYFQSNELDAARQLADIS